MPPQQDVEVLVSVPSPKHETAAYNEDGNFTNYIEVLNAIYLVLNTYLTLTQVANIKRTKFD